MMRFFNLQHARLNEEMPLTATHYGTYGTYSYSQESVLQLRHFGSKGATTPSQVVSAKTNAFTDELVRKMKASDEELKKIIAKRNQALDENGVASNSMPFLLRT